MDALLKTFRNFLFRDFFYVVCGVLILRAAQEIGRPAFGAFTGHETFDVIVLAGIAYALGYLNQEIWSQFGFVTTAGCSHFGRFTKFFYRRHTKTEWREVAHPPTVEQSKQAEREDAFNRIINHRLVGASMGSALLTVSVMLLAAAIRHGSARLAWPLLVTVPLAAAFLVLSWVKAMQQCEYLDQVRVS